MCTSLCFFFARVYRFGCIFMCVWHCVHVCVCYTGVLSLYLHTSPLTWECTLYIRQSSNTHTHMSTHMDTTAHTPLNYMNLSEVWGGSDTWCFKWTIYVADQSKGILLGLRNDLSSMYEKNITHTLALIKCLPGVACWNAEEKMAASFASILAFEILADYVNTVFFTKV